MLSWPEWNANYQLDCEQGHSEYKSKICRRQMYKTYVINQRKEMQTNSITGFTSQYSVTDLYPLAPCTPVPCNPLPKGYAPCDGRIYKKQEEENLMNYASASISTPATETQDQRKYLTRRLDEVYMDKRGGLEAKFGLIDDEPPATLKDLKERIEAGKFSLREEEDISRYHYWTDMIRWRDPAKKADQEGFDAARKDLKAKKLAALDTIKIDEPKAGLDAVKALEAWEPTGAAN